MQDNIKIIIYLGDNLLYLIYFDCSLFRRNSHESRHSNLPSATSRICHKLEKVCVDTSTEKRVLGTEN